MPVRVAATAILAALAIVPRADAHATVTPAHAQAGRPQLLLVTVPNENLDAPLGMLRITLPAGAEPLSARAVEGDWRMRIEGRTVELRGGPIAGGFTASFRVRARFDRVGETPFAVEERYGVSAASRRYVVPFVVTTPADPAGDGGVDAMVFVALGIFGALGAGCFFLLLARWLRS